jgi:hypothetical protein
MTYRISYDHGFAASTGPRGHEGATRTEYFRGEHDALRRARELIENGDYHAVAVHDGTGSVLTGILLQLKLGAAIAD